MIFLNQLLVDTRLTVETVNEGDADHAAEITVTLNVLGQQNQVPSGRVGYLLLTLGIAVFDVAVFVQTASASAIGLYTNNRFEGDELRGFLLQLGQLFLVFGQRFFSRLAVLQFLRHIFSVVFGQFGTTILFRPTPFTQHFFPLGFLGNTLFGLCDPLLAILHLAFGSPVHFLRIVEKILHAVHITVVGQGHGMHAGAEAFIHQFVYLRHAVEERIMGVNVQVCESIHSVILCLSLLFDSEFHARENRLGVEVEDAVHLASHGKSATVTNAVGVSHTLG